VKLLTRQVADSLTPTTSPNESSNIEQELLDVLRGHRVVSKNARRTDTKSEPSQEYSEQGQKSTTKRQTHSTSDADVEKTNEAFS
jgi:hypothetical protein